MLPFSAKRVSLPLLTLLKNISVLQIAYLGCSNIDEPGNEDDVIRIISILNEEKKDEHVEIALTVPCTSRGIVRLVAFNL